MHHSPVIMTKIKLITETDTESVDYSGLAPNLEEKYFGVFNLLIPCPILKCVGLRANLLFEN